MAWTLRTFFRSTIDMGNDKFPITWSYVLPRVKYKRQYLNYYVQLNFTDLCLIAIWCLKKMYAEFYFTGAYISNKMD